jgi:predicted PurR-regulated permease PerM
MQQRVERFLWPAVLAMLGVACVLVLRPFFSAILWSAILTYTTWPVYCRLRDRVGGRRSLASGLMTIIIVLALVIPIAIAVFGLVRNAETIGTVLAEWVESGVPRPPAWVVRLPLFGETLYARWLAISEDGAQLGAALRPLFGPAKDWGLAVTRALAEGAFTLAVSALISFFLYRDGDAVSMRIQRLMTRMAGPSALPLLEVAQATIRGVVYGIIGTGVAQAVLQAIGLLIAGVPGALVWGGITFLLSLVPVGPPLVWGGAAIWLYMEGHLGWALFLAAWGLLVVSSVDNVIKPYLISRGARLPFVLVLLGVLGGVLAFGVIGVFIGPTLLAVAYRLTLEWSAMREPDAVAARAGGPPPDGGPAA